MERLNRKPAQPDPDVPTIREEDLPAIASTLGDVYKIAVPNVVRLLGGKAGQDTPLTPDEEKAARAVIELGVKIYKRAILENSAALIIGIGLGTPVLVRLSLPAAPSSNIVPAKSKEEVPA